MKRLTAITVAVMISAGCAEPPRETLITGVEPDHLAVQAEGGSFDITVHGSENWTTDNSAGWISISRNGGAATVSVEENPGAARSRTITFRNGFSSTVLNLTQECSDIFTATPSEIQISYKGGTAGIDVEAYEHWTVRCLCDWIRTSSESGDGPGSVDVEVKRNPGKDTRSGSLEVICGERTRTVTVTQGPSPYIALEKESVDIDGDGGVISVLYASNTGTEISTEESWIRLIDSSAEYNAIAFEVLRNMSSPRTGRISIASSEDKEYCKFLTINQGEKIDHPNLSFEEGHSVELAEKGTFSLHPVFEDMADTTLSWSSDNPGIASVDQNGTVTVHTGGRCIITAKNIFHGVTAAISLNIRIKAEGMTVLLDSQDMESNPTAVRFPGERLTVSVMTSPEDAYSDDIVCISSDPEVAEADGKTIICRKPGQASISVESLYQGIRKTFTLIVIDG